MRKKSMKTKMGNIGTLEGMTAMYNALKAQYMPKLDIYDCIAHHFGCSSATVYRTLKKHGII